LGTGTRDVLWLVIQGESIFREAWAACSGGVCTKVVLGEGDREGGVGGKVEFSIAFAPISVQVMVSLCYFLCRP
jgi:hypothetical protein